ncbi:MAG: hypothetical protein JOZ08_13600 [Verrucomicrobia bacterium]|nr:hypothetical protein [Verrucomicrobiota bacterium]
MENFQELCAVLNRFALPRAIVDFEHRSFVAWNPKFLEHTGITETEMKASKTGDLLTFGETWFPLSSESDAQKIEYLTCALKRPFGGSPAPGFIVRSHDRIGYVMLDVFGSSSSQFEQGQVVGREEERNRIVKVFHEEVSPSIIAALFLIQTAKSELEEAGSPQAEIVSKASDILTESTRKIAGVLSEPDDREARS